MKKLIAGIVASVALVGCTTTKIQYVDKLVYVAVKVDDSLFQLGAMPTPPTKEQFIFLTPTDQTETITLLKGQRDLLVDYSVDMTRDSGVCRARLERIKKLQDKQVQTIEKRGAP